MATRKRRGSRKIKNHTGGKKKRITRTKRATNLIYGGLSEEEMEKQWNEKMKPRWADGFKATKVKYPDTGIFSRFKSNNEVHELYKVEWKPDPDGGGIFTFDFSVFGKKYTKEKEQEGHMKKVFPTLIQLMNNFYIQCFASKTNQLYPGPTKFDELKTLKDVQSTKVLFTFKIEKKEAKIDELLARYDDITEESIYLPPINKALTLKSFKDTFNDYNKPSSTYGLIFE
jgi:hypothetical protein